MSNENLDSKIKDQGWSCSPCCELYARRIVVVPQQDNHVHVAINFSEIEDVEQFLSNPTLPKFGINDIVNIGASTVIAIKDIYYNSRFGNFLYLTYMTKLDHYGFYKATGNIYLYKTRPYDMWPGTHFVNIISSQESKNIANQKKYELSQKHELNPPSRGDRQLVVAYSDLAELEFLLN